MGDYRHLEVWRASRELATAVYRLTSAFPDSERFGITSQMRRAAVSVMSNIAEGAGRGTDRQFLAMLRIAAGSLRELESQYLLAVDLGFCSEKEINGFRTASKNTGRRLTGLMKALTRPGSASGR